MKAQSIHLFQSKLKCALAAIDDAKQALQGLPHDHCGRIESKIAHAETTVDDAISMLMVKANKMSVETRDDEDVPYAFAQGLGAWLSETRVSRNRPSPFETVSPLNISNPTSAYRATESDKEEIKMVALSQWGVDIEAAWRDDAWQWNCEMIPNEIRIDMLEVRIQETMS